jgi:hypothetical protein
MILHKVFFHFSYRIIFRLCFLVIFDFYIQEGIVRASGLLCLACLSKLQVCLSLQIQKLYCCTPCARRDKKRRRGTHFGSCCSTLNSILMFDSVGPFSLMVDDALHFCLIETIDNGIFALRYINWSVSVWVFRSIEGGGRTRTPFYLK